MQYEGKEGKNLFEAAEVGKTLFENLDGVEDIGAVDGAWFEGEVVLEVEGGHLAQVELS